MKESFSIRNYKKGDFKAIEQLWKETGLGGPQRGDTEAIVEGAIELGGIFLVMVSDKDNRIAGTSWITFDGRRMHLHHFGIGTLYQGNGLAKKLLNESLRFVKSKGYQVKIEVHDTNDRALRLYEKAGFKPLGDYHVYMIRDLEKLIIELID